MKAAFISLPLPLLACAFLTGCGTTTSVSTTPPPPSTAGTGNWLISGFYQLNQGIGPYVFGGSLLRSGAQISGVFHIDQSCFGSGTTDIPYTGTLDSKNHLSITSAPVSGQILTFEGTLSSDDSSITDASFTVTGGCTGSIVTSVGPGAEIETTAIQLPSFTGSWSTAASSSNLGLGEQLTQSTTPDAHGDYALTGTVSIQNFTCATHGTLQSGSFVSGDLGQETVLLDDGSILSAMLQVGYNPVVEARPSLTLYPATITGGQYDGPVDVNLE